MSQKIKTSVEIDGSLSASQIANATTDTDKFLVSDGGTIKYRTGAELATDLGISAGVTSKVQHQVKAGVAINKGQAVYVTSADGTNMIVGLASNASESTSSKTMGLLNATVSTNGFADVITEGLLSGLDTSTAVVGNPVWLGTGGNLIYGLANKPYAPAHLVFIGIVTRVNANNGEIFVKVQNGFELDEIHDVDLKTTTPINGHLLGYNGTLWVNKTIAGWLGYTPQSQLNGAGFVKASGTTITYDNTSYYPASNPNGYISTYTETDTLASVTGRGASTSTLSTFDGGLNIGNAKLRWGGTTSPTLGFPFTGGPNAFWIDVNDGDTGGLAIDNDGTTIYGAGDSGHVFRVIDEDVYQATTNIDASTTFRIQQGQNGGGYIRGNFEITGTLNASGYNKTNWDTAYGWGNHAGLYLGISSKAADSELLDGIDSTRVIFGDNSTGTISISDTTLNGALKSGFYTVGTGGIPNATSVNFVLHTAYNGVGNAAGFDLACNDSTTSSFYLRPATGGGKGSWQTIVTSANVGSYAVPTSRTITINGTSYDLSANRSWTVTASETDTLATVTGRGASTSTRPSFDGGITVNGQSYVTASGYFVSGAQGFRWNDSSGVYNNVIMRDNGTTWFRDYLETSSSMRAGIFYDYNDTGYYVDPASISKIAKLYIRNGGAAGVGWSTGLVMGDDSNYWNLIQDAGVARQRNFGTGGYDWFNSSAGTQLMALNNGGVLSVSGDVRSQVFYDSNDTSYYLDPNSTSRLLAVNAPSGFTSVGNPWGTANSAYFPNGITTAGSDNWIYGHTYVGNAPANGAGHEFWSTGKEYHRSSEATNGHGASGRWLSIQSANGNFIPYSFESEYGNHSWGTVARFRVNQSGADRPSIQFSSASSDNRWNIGYCAADDNFRIVQNMGYRNDNSTSDGWGTERLLIYTDGNIYSNGLYQSNASLRSPIFYDSNDTGYYINPNSESRLDTINSARFATDRGSQNPDSSHPGFGIRPFYSWNIGQAYNSGAGYSNGITIGSHPGDQSYGFQIVQNMWDDQLYFRRYNGGWQGWRTALDNTNYGGYCNFGGNSLYAGIFYDGNNSAYYVNPDGTSRMGTINADTLKSYGNLYLDNDYGRTVVGVYSSYRYQGVFSMGSSWMLPSDGTSPGNLYGLSWSHPNAGGQAGYLNNHGLLVMVNGQTEAAISTGIWARGDVTAYSDIRVKDNIKVIDNPLERLKKVRGVTFTRIDLDDKEKRYAGVIAQEMIEALPEVVTENTEGHLSVSYGNSVSLLIECIKEQQTQIEELKQLVNKLINK